MSIELIRYQRDKNSGELYATLPNGKCAIELNANFLLKRGAKFFLSKRTMVPKDGSARADNHSQIMSIFSLTFPIGLFVKLIE